MLWAWLAVVAGMVLAPALLLDRKLVRDRFRKQEGVDTGRLLVIRLCVLMHLVAGLLDSLLLHWSDTVPQALRVFGLVVLALSAGVTYVAMAHNRFFMPVIRIQDDRGHRVEDRGPYAIVRHPGYAGMILLAPGSALGLGSWLAVGIALVPALLFIVRTAHEDRFLHEHLPGYRDYSAKVRYRLIPGVW